MPGGARALWRLGVKFGPRLVAVITAASAFIASHPEVPAWFRRRLENVQEKIAAAQQQRGDAAKIRAMLTIIREVAGELDAHDGEQPSTDPATWLRRADSIDRGVRLAEAQPRPDQKKTLARLRTETGDLLAELIEVTTPTYSAPAAESQHEQRQDTEQRQEHLHEQEQEQETP